MKTALKIYDTAKRSKREFAPLSPPKVKMYCCGPTVYGYLHIGNFRGAVFFNFVRNWLEAFGWEVDYIYNFTDIDDKILKRAREEKTKPKALAEKYIEEFKKDYKALKLRPHSANPRAAETLPEIIQLIQQLIDRGAAYQTEGDVFFSVKSCKEYGSLSGRKTEDLLAGARVEVDERKKNPLDFALWKQSKPEDAWRFESPWGEGRPGWHIECSAMTKKFLGDEIDIHAGGSDLIFPHHENEIAQSTAVTGKKHVRFWLHNNMISMEGEKMSKSLGNIISMREFLSQYPGELFKFMILSSHYRSPLQFSKKTLHQAMASLSKIYSSLARASQMASQKSAPREDFQSQIQQAEEDISSAFNDDFATPKAFAVLFSALSSFQKILADKKAPTKEKAFCAKIFLALFKKYGAFLSLFQEEPEAFLKELDDSLLKKKNVTREQIQKLVEERGLARKNKDWGGADKIREQLDRLGVEVQDSARGSSWELKK